MSRAICKKCGGVMFWSARRGIRLADYKHRDLQKRTPTDCDGELVVVDASCLKNKKNQLPISVIVK